MPNSNFWTRIRRGMRIHNSRLLQTCQNFQSVLPLPPVVWIPSSSNLASAHATSASCLPVVASRQQLVFWLRNLFGVCSHLNFQAISVERSRDASCSIAEYKAKCSADPGTVFTCLDAKSSKGWMFYVHTGSIYCSCSCYCSSCYITSVYDVCISCYSCSHSFFFHRP